MKTYTVRLINHEGQKFDCQFSSFDNWVALEGAMKFAETHGIAVTPYVEVLDPNGEVCWDSFRCPV